MASSPPEAYRLGFPAGAAIGAASIGLWASALNGSGGGLDRLDHLVLGVWGFLGTMVLGFLWTAYPRQNGAAPPGTRTWGLALAAQLGGVACWWGGARELGLALLAFVAIGSAAAATWIARRSLQQKWDATTAGAPVALWAGVAGLAAVAAGELGAARDLGIHAFLVPLAVLLLDRVLPFFSKKRVPNYAGGRLPGSASGAAARRRAPLGAGAGGRGALVARPPRRSCFGPGSAGTRGRAAGCRWWPCSTSAWPGWSSDTPRPGSPEGWRRAGPRSTGPRSSTRW